MRFPDLSDLFSKKASKYILARKMLVSRTVGSSLKKLYHSVSNSVKVLILSKIPIQFQFECCGFHSFRDFDNTKLEAIGVRQCFGRHCNPNNSIPIITKAYPLVCCDTTVRKSHPNLIK